MVKEDIVIVLPRELRRLMLTWAQACKEETGGALVGYRLTHKDGRKLWMLRTFLPPGPSASHSPASFAQGGLYQAALLSLLRKTEQWPAKGGWKTSKATFLGDWHSHPSFSAKPSAGDKQTVKSLLEEEPSLPGFVVLIAANGQSSSWSLGAHLALRQEEKVVWQEGTVIEPEALGLDEVMNSLEPWPSPSRLHRMVRKIQERRRHVCEH